MKKPRAALIPLAAGLALGFVPSASSDSTVSCRPWQRLNGPQKAATVPGMIDDALRSNRARQYDVNRDAMRRCLLARVTQMAIAFDDVCSDPRSADMQAINRVFKTYVWSCAG